VCDELKISKPSSNQVQPLEVNKPWQKHELCGKTTVYFKSYIVK
jgi:hypothetical protein